MVEAMIKLTHSLGMSVLAEGVETAEEERLLKELGCDYAQGWLYAKALSNGELQAFLSASDEQMQYAARPSLTA
jgi:EAL domain-containing protein (putative c-di-GMP-specific phosphodiesterase class I)